MRFDVVCEPTVPAHSDPPRGALCARWAGVKLSGHDTLPYDQGYLIENVIDVAHIHGRPLFDWLRRLSPTKWG